MITYLLAGTSRVQFAPTFLQHDDARLLAALLREIPFVQRQVTVWNKTHDEPRLSSWHGDPQCVYTYSRLTLAPNPWSQTLAWLRDQVTAAAGEQFNSVLVNLYRDGHDRMGWHADDEACFGTNPTIASLSLGHPRRFRLKHKDDPNDQHRFELGNGSLLIMSGETQRHYRHAVGKTARPVGPRINLTFRRFLEDPLAVALRPPRRVP